MKTVSIFAHRGASHQAPENTLEAFQKAVDQGVDGIELDVQMTKDQVLVVAHDEQLERVSNGKGDLRDHTLQELRALDFSCGHDEYSQVKIPTLAEVLELVKDSDIVLNIELKTSLFWYPGIEDATVQLVQEKSMEDRVIYSSFNHYSIQKIKTLAPQAQTAYLFFDVIVDAEHYTLNAGVPAIHPCFCQLLMPEILERYKNSDVKVRVWTVDEPQLIKQFMAAGVDAIITNEPELALKIRREMEENKC